MAVKIHKIMKFGNPHTDQYSHSPPTIPNTANITASPLLHKMSRNSSLSKPVLQRLFPVEGISGSFSWLTKENYIENWSK